MKSEIHSGRVSQHGHGLGTHSEQMIRQRASEIAKINGRPEDKFNEDDLEQARQELSGTASSPATAGFDSGPNIKEWDQTNDETGTRGVTKRPDDEQTVAEQLVEEGKEEATHEQMLEGSRASRKADHY